LTSHCELSETNEETRKSEKREMNELKGEGRKDEKNEICIVSFLFVWYFEAA
jgi:hypothetical protein